MPYAKADVERAIQFWKLAQSAEIGLAIAVNIDRRYFSNILQEARAKHLGTEEAYEFKVLVPESPEDEVWIIRRDDGDGPQGSTDGSSRD